MIQERTSSFLGLATDNQHSYHDNGFEQAMWSWQWENGLNIFLLWLVEFVYRMTFFFIRIHHYNKTTIVFLFQTTIAIIQTFTHNSYQSISYFIFSIYLFYISIYILNSIRFTWTTAWLLLIHKRSFWSGNILTLRMNSTF